MCVCALALQYERRKLGTTVTYHVNQEKSLNFFSVTHPLRAACIRWIAINPWFEVFVLLTILVNCVFLAMTDPPEAAE